MLFKLNINGKTRSVEAEPGTPLLWVIRDELNLTGTKFGCGVAACGSCTVHFNGTPIRSCSFPVDSAAGNDITTVRGPSGKGRRGCAAGLARHGCRTMRLLPVRPDHVRRGLAEQ